MGNFKEIEKERLLNYISGEISESAKQAALIELSVLFRKLKQTRSSNEKKSLIKSAIEADNTNILKFFITIGCSPFVVFGISSKTLSKYTQNWHRYSTQIESSKKGIDRIFFDYCFNRPNESDKTISLFLFKVFQFSNDFENETGHDISYILDNIILKKMDIGASIQTFQSCGIEIEKFGCQLATPFDRDLIDPDKQYYIEPKIDGARTIAFVDTKSNSVSMFSREGTEIKGYNEIESELLDMAKIVNEKTHIDDVIVFDGEIYSGSFDSTMNNFLSKAENKKANYIVWDTLGYEDFCNGDTTLIFRRKYISSHTLLRGSSCVEFINYQLTTGRTILNMNNTLFTKSGFEGDVIKLAEAKYEQKRSKSWIKRKDFLECDVKIVDVIEGTGKFEGMAGSIVVEYWVVTTNKNIFLTREVDKSILIRCEVGTGFSDEQRIDMFNNQDAFLGKAMEVQYQELSKDLKLRFSSFKRFKN